MNALTEHVWGVSAAADRVWAQVCGLRTSEAPRRLLMVLQAYIDDSYDDGGTYVLAGYVASAEQWAAFSLEWERALAEFGLTDKNGRRYFKMSHMARRSDTMENVKVFHGIINRHVMMCLSVSLSMKDLKAATERVIVDEGQFQSHDQPFIVAYVKLMSEFHSARLNHSILENIEEPVDFIFDRTDEGKFIERGWNEFTSRIIEPKLKAIYGDVPRFVDSNQFLPIQAADFRAWWVRKWINTGEVVGTFPWGSLFNNVHHIHFHHSEDSITWQIILSFRQKFGVSVYVEDKGNAEENILDSPIEENFLFQKVKYFLMGLVRRKVA